MIAFIRQLISVPLRVLVWLCGFLPIFDRLKLVEVIWFLTRQAPDAAAVISLTASSKGIEAANQRAEKIFDQLPDGLIASTIGWLQVQNNHNLQSASNWLQRSRQGCQNPELTWHLELMLSANMPEYNPNEVADRILARNDLPMQFSRDALLIKGQILLKQQQWTQARAVAKKILNVENNTYAQKLLEFAEQNRDAEIFTG